MNQPENYLHYLQMQCIHTITGHSLLKPNYFAISFDNKTLISNAHSLTSGEEQYENVNFWDLSTGKLIKSLDFLHDHMNIGFSGQFIVGIVYNADVIIVLNLKTDELNFILDSAPDCINLPEKEINFSPIATSIYGSILACGDFVYTSPQEGVIVAYDLLSEPLSSKEIAIKIKGENLLWKPERYPDCNSSVLISSDGKILLSQAVRTRYGFHRLWDLSKRELIRTFDISGLAEFIAITSEGQALACGRRQGLVQVWNLYTDETICSLVGDLPTAMTPDGKILAYCSAEAKITLWDIEKNHEICTLREDTAKIEWIAISPNREWLASYSVAQTIKIWGIR